MGEEGSARPAMTILPILNDDFSPPSLPRSRGPAPAQSRCPSRAGGGNNEMSHSNQSRTMHRRSFQVFPSSALCFLSTQESLPAADTYCVKHSVCKSSPPQWRSIARPFHHGSVHISRKPNGISGPSRHRNLSPIRRCDSSKHCKPAHHTLAGSANAWKTASSEYPYMCPNVVRIAARPAR